MSYKEQAESLRYYATHVPNLSVSFQAHLWQAANAIEELQQTVQHYKGCSDDWYKEACDYKALVPKWIPVTEEPPLKVGDEGYNGYLVYANGYYEVADYTTDKFDNVPSFHVNGEYEPDVTYYMPLPEPPEETE